MSSFQDQLAQWKVVPVIALDDADAAVPLAEALTAGGLPCMEITFRTSAAAAAIAKVAGREGLLVGAGTVLEVDQAKAAIDAGAQFLVSPGVHAPVIEHAKAAGIPILPGVATPTDIDRARELGVELVKFFPAAAFGGTKTLKALSGPYRNTRFVPTGGISADNLADYLALPTVVACGGSWLAAGSLIAAGRWDEITELTREALRIAQSASSS